MEPLYFQMALGLFSAIVSGLVSFVWWKIKKLDEKREELAKKHKAEQEEVERKLQHTLSMLKEGTVSILHDRLIDVMSKCEIDGCKRLYQIENVNHMMNAYTGLGGNGTVKHLYGKFQNLPMEQQKQPEA